MAVDDRGIDQLEALESGVASHRVEARGGEPPVNEVIVSVDRSRRGDVNRRGIEQPIRRTVGLEQHPAAGGKAPAYDFQQSQRVLDPVQDPKAEDEVECLVELVQVECVEAPVVDFRAEQLPNCGKPLPTLQLDTPTGADPLLVLLVVDRNHPGRATHLCEEGVEAVEGADVEHSQSAEILGQGGEPVTVIPGNAVRVDTPGAVQCEGVEPDRHPLEDVSGGLWVGIDRDQIGHLTLGISWLGRGFQSYAILGAHIVAQRNGVSNGWKRQSTSSWSV